MWIAWIHAYVLRGRSFWQVSALQNSSWSWRKLLHLRALANRLVEWQNGVAVWKIVGDKYSVAKVWEEIRPKQDKVQWHRLLWTPLAIPRYSVITWMTLLNRLPTMDRLTSWGIKVAEPVCYVKMRWKLEIICSLIVAFHEESGKTYCSFVDLAAMLWIGMQS